MFSRIFIPLFVIISFYLFQIGKGVVRKGGKDICLVGYGTMVGNCLKASEIMSEYGKLSYFCKNNITVFYCSGYTICIYILMRFIF